MSADGRKLSVLGFIALALCAGTASADVINFEQFHGPSTFGSPEQTLTIPWSLGSVTVSGGTILTDTTFLSADETTVYGTKSGFSQGYSSTITLTFTQNINNFFLNLYNGQTHQDTFTVSDNLGRSTTVTLDSNLNGGTSLVSFPAIGNVVTITTTDPHWDFFIDNIGFNQATPGTPEPATIGLIAISAIALAAYRKRLPQRS